MEKPLTAKIQNYDHDLYTLAMHVCDDPESGYRCYSRPGWEVDVVDVRNDFKVMLMAWVPDLGAAKRIAQEVVETLVGTSVNLAWEEDSARVSDFTT